MTTNPLWFVLAGFLLGFATSTLWEWFHYRKERLRLIEQQTRAAEAGVRSRVQSAVAGRARAADAPWSGQAYRSPGVFLESEDATEEQERPVAQFVSETLAARDEPLTPPTISSITAPRPAGPAPRRRQEVLEALRRTSEVAAAKPETPPKTQPLADNQPAEPPPVAATSRATSAPDLAPPDPARAWRNDPQLTRRSEGYPDDLSKIKGIGDVYRQRLFRAGIYTWRQIAEADLEVLRQATGAYPSSNVEEWPVQARALMAKYGRENAAYNGPPPDELTKILGIGPVSAQTLYKAGICTYEQLASTPVSALAALFPIAVAGDQPDFAAWIVQAARLADEKHRA